jgi:hypothetical protein
MGSAPVNGVWCHHLSNVSHSDEAKSASSNATAAAASIASGRN